METRVRYIVVGFFTLLCCASAVFFLFWLQNKGSFQGRREVVVKFQGPTAGLRVGAPVDFNGLRVGDVAQLALDPNDPNSVDVLLSLQGTTPLTTTTHARLGTEGLMGSVYVSLQGSSGEPLIAAAGQKRPELVATATGSLVDEAQSTLSGIQGVISDNAKPLHQIIGNIQDFSAVLAHNSKRVDDILGGLAHLTGGGEAEKAPLPTFDLAPPTSVQGLRPGGNVQLVVADPTSLVALDTQRFLSRKSDGQIAMQPDQWSDTIPKLIQKKVVQTFDNAGFRFASPPSDGLNPDYQLLLEIRSFQINESPSLTANIQMEARLLGKNGKIVDSRVIEGSAPAQSLNGPGATTAMNAAFSAAASQLLLWCQETSSKDAR